MSVGPSRAVANPAFSTEYVDNHRASKDGRKTAMPRLDRSETDRGDGRTDRGRFAPGSEGGPGRPRRAIEADYMGALSAACPPETWRIICERAVQGAIGGNARDREWLSRLLIGDTAPSLADMAADELSGFDRVSDEAAFLKLQVDANARMREADLRVAAAIDACIEADEREKRQRETHPGSLDPGV